MSENLDLVEILKDCPKGTKLYSPIYGEVEFEEVNDDETYPITVKTKNEDLESFTSDGRWSARYKGECLLFPSKDQRDWNKFKTKKPKFDPNTLKPFDKVLARETDTECWTIQFFSYITKYENSYPYVCVAYNYKYCIPYNDDTKHLAGTIDEAPEFYRYWED